MNKLATPRHEDNTEQGRIVGMITFAVVTHQHVEVREGGGSTVGQLIDDHLAECAHNGLLVRDVRLELEERDWADMARHLVDTTRRRAD